MIVRIGLMDADKKFMAENNLEKAVDEFIDRNGKVIEVFSIIIKLPYQLLLKRLVRMKIYLILRVMRKNIKLKSTMRT